VDHQLRRTKLSARLPELEVEALLVTRLPNVRYVTGFTGSNGQALITSSGEGNLFLTDGRYTEQSRHEVPDMERDPSPADFPARIAEAFRDAGVSRVGFETAGVTYKLWQQLTEKSGVELVPVGDEIERLRWIKDPEEIELLNGAQAITDEAFERIQTKMVEGISERDLALELEWAMRQAGAEGLSFDSIVAFGENAAEPHHHPADRTLGSGDVVKFDFGALFGGYHADMTRTVAFGEPDPKFREIHELVAAAQRAGIEAVRAGVTGRDADAASRKVIEDAGYADAFSHSLGHGVGLEIHEGPTLRTQSDDVLPAGAVVTVEPGVYLPGIGGVRIEDTLVVGANGAEPLTLTPKDLVL